MGTSWDIGLTHRVDGVLTNVTSPGLRDAAHTYAVRRVDTGAIIVPLGPGNAAVPMVQLPGDTGRYHYLVTGLTAGVAYQAYVEFTYAGADHRYERNFTATADATHFTSKAAARNFGGAYNADTYADKDNTDDADLIDAAWEQALTGADVEIIAAYRVRLFEAGKGTAADFAAYDLAPGSVADANDSAWLDETARMGTLVKLYEGRGQADDGTSAGPSPDGKMEALRKRYMDRLMAIQSGNAILATAALAGITVADEWGSVEVNDPVYPTVDADGLPTTASNVPSIYRGPRWDRAYGYRW